MINKKINIKMIKSNYLLFVLFFVLFFYLFNGVTIVNVNFLVILTFGINAIYIISNIFLDNYSYSLNKTFWYFSLIFFFVTPLIQYLSAYYPWYHYMSDSMYVNTNIFILVSFIIYDVSRKFVMNNKQNSKWSNKIDFSYKKLNFLVIISILSFFALLILVGFSRLFLRSDSQVNLGAAGLNTILNIGLRSIPVYAFTYCYYYYKKNNKGLIYLIILMFFIIILNFPQALSRYMLGIVYIGLSLIIFKKFLKNRRFDCLLLIVFLFVFPITQLFKSMTFSEILSNSEIIINKMRKAYNDVDFDAYSMFSRTIELTYQQDFTYGKQILSTIFFFVPRTIWISKPYHSGIYVASQQNQVFTNLSCPLIAEGYLDFGIFGLVLYTSIISMVITKLDFVFWNSNENNMINMYYPFLFGCLIFILRGALQPTYIYCFSYLLFYLIFLRWFLKIKLKK